MVASVISGAVLGIEAYRVEVEVALSKGMMVFSTVGLPGGAVCESRIRVKSALDACGYEFPRRRITVNLAPAHIRKTGTAFDLPIALGILIANGKLPADALRDTLVLGELSLDGRVRPVRGVLPLAAHGRRTGLRRALVPAQNSAEAALIEGMEIWPIDHLATAVEALRPEGTAMERARSLPPPPPPTDAVDLADVRGQSIPRRALEVAAAGGHNLLFIGPPGAGKTMLARRMPTIAPPMTPEEQIETSIICSVAGLLRSDEPLICRRPFRAPHHSVSDAALVGGGPMARPGEVSLAHNGVLFLDELPEFRRNVLEALRQPLEDGEVCVCRARQALRYPARFTLVASMNPCPCGYYGHPRHACTCYPTAVSNYRARVSGPLLDRIDLHVPVEPLAPAELDGEPCGEPSAAVRERVIAARARQTTRLAASSIRCNADMSARAVSCYARPDRPAAKLLREAVERLGLSARAHTRVLKVARTIADLDEAEKIGVPHIAEAIQYRQLDRGWDV